MALDKSFVGKAFAPFTFEVDKSKIRELAQSLGDDNPIFFDDDDAQAAGLPGIVAPPTFPSVLKMWGEGGSSPHIKTMGGNALRLLHGSEEYEYYAFIRPGDILTGQTRVVSIETKESRSGPLEIVVLQTDYHNQRGEPVIVARTSIVLRE